ncbi:hypothetical protein BDV12DRAFT_159517 [Aspergillus spectabilis]
MKSNLEFHQCGLQLMIRGLGHGHDMVYYSMFVALAGVGLFIRSNGEVATLFFGVVLGAINQRLATGK